MVFIGGWRSRRPARGPYGRRQYGGGGGGCLRDVCLVESGCCLAESFGCGPQLTLLAPLLTRDLLRSARSARPGPPTTWGDAAVRRLVAAIGVYQREISSRRTRPCCRYSPSCSVYAVEALEVHGLRTGLWLAARRLLRCRPGTRGGDDPVPARGGSR